MDEHKAEPFFLYLPLAEPHVAMQPPQSHRHIRDGAEACRDGELIAVQLGDARKGRPLRIDVGEGLELLVKRDFNGDELHRQITALISSC